MLFCSIEDSAQVTQISLVYSPRVLQQDPAPPAWVHGCGGVGCLDRIPCKETAFLFIRIQPPVMQVAVLKPGKLLVLSDVLQAESEPGLFSIRIL